MTQGRDGEQQGRDRDQAGRPRNARPRDAQGRPLPKGAHGEARVPDDLVLPPTEALALAQQFIDQGRPFQAHEVLEASWKSAPAGERDLWQGLAQVAVGLTHAQRGNAPGAAALLRRGAERITGYRPAGPHAPSPSPSPFTATGPHGPPLPPSSPPLSFTAAGPHGIDVSGVAETAAALAARIERDGTAAVPERDLRLRLSVRPSSP